VGDLSNHATRRSGSRIFRTSLEARSDVEKTALVYGNPRRFIDTGEEESEDEGASYVPEQKVNEFSTMHFGSVASRYVSSYAYRARNVDKDFGIPREAD